MDSIYDSIHGIRKKVTELSKFLLAIPSVPEVIRDIEICQNEIALVLSSIKAKLLSASMQSFDGSTSDEPVNYLHDVVAPSLIILQQGLRKLDNELQNLDVSYEICLEYIERYLRLRIETPDFAKVEKPGSYLVNEVDKAMHHFFNKRGVLGILEIHGQPQSLSEEKCGHILGIICEAVANSLKHSKSSFVKITLSFEESMFFVRIEDSGCGFDSDFASRDMGGYGLHSMHERAKLISGNLTITSCPGSGCAILLSIPKQGDQGEPGKQQLHKCILN